MTTTVTFNCPLEYNKTHNFCMECVYINACDNGIVTQEFITAQPEGVQILSPRIVPSSVQKCPVCEGRGIVPGGFYLSTTGDIVYKSNAMVACRSCNGTGIIKI